jgi:hypothetical protein
MTRALPEQGAFPLVSPGLPPMPKSPTEPGSPPPSQMGLTPPTSAPGPNRLTPATAPPRYGSPHNICTGTDIGLAKPAHICTHICGLAESARPPLAHISTATGVTLQQLRWGWAHPSHNSTGTGLIPPTSSLGLNRPTPSHICTGTRLNSSLICAGLNRSPTSHLRNPSHICTGTGLTPHPHRHRPALK